MKKRKQQRRNRSAIAREQHLKDWNLTTARKFGADSDGHGRHPILTDARGVTDHQDGWRSSWESLVNLNLETCISSLAGPGGAALPRRRPPRGATNPFPKPDENVA